MSKRFMVQTMLAAVLSFGPATRALAVDNVAVSTGWLKSHLHDPDLVLLHVDDEGGPGAEQRYRAAHIPGARFVGVEDFSTSTAGKSLEMPSIVRLRQELEGLGISSRSRIILYYGNDGVALATRILFTLEAAGFGPRAQLLDGGWRKWRQDGGAITAQATPPARRSKLASLTLHAPVVDAAFVQRHTGQPGYAVIDARAPVYFNGLEPSGAREHRQRGHIPGARNLPFDSVTNADFTLKTPEQLRALFRSAGVKPGDRVIAYCHIGQQATEVVAAARAAGIDAMLYDGSFEDWTTRNLPVTR